MSEYMDATKQNIDKEKLRRLLPKGTSHKVTNEIINLINSMGESTGIMQEYMEESFLHYLPMLRGTKVSLEKYINAIKYCNLKRSMTNIQAWEIVFPEKYDRLRREGKSIDNHVAMYNATEIVTKIDAQMLLDVKIQYAPALHMAINKEIELMQDDDVSPYIQHLASKTIIETLMPLEEQKVDITIGRSDEDKAAQSKMFSKMVEIAENQQKLIEQGVSIEEVQRLNLVIEAESEDDDYIDVEDDEDDA